MKFRVFIFVLICSSVFAQFVEIDPGFPGLQEPELVWGDYDSDGDLDILMMGFADGTSTRISRIYRNEGGPFVDIAADLENVAEGAADWGDYDNDGDLDLILSGDTGTSSGVTKVFRNDGGIFNDINAGLVDANGRVSWGDYDNDGDPDILFTGSNQARIYENRNGTFVEDTAAQADLRVANANDLVASAWGDYDNDGDLDIVISGGNYESDIYRNDNGVFVNIEYEFDATFDGRDFPGTNGVKLASVEWGDYNNDGLLDLLVTGQGRDSDAGTEAKVTILYRNDGPDLNNEGQWLFEQVPPLGSRTIQGVQLGAGRWGDYDNDGDLDILLVGSIGTSINQNDYVGSLYLNRGDDPFLFDATQSAVIRGVGRSRAAWGDYDGDGDLDIILAGYNGTTNGGIGYITRIYRNDTVPSNDNPDPPDVLQQTVRGDSVWFSWNRGSDEHTLATGLSYNIMVGTASDSIDIVSPNSDVSDGYRKIVATGNTGTDTTWVLKNLTANQNYYWRVQSIDASFLGSAFSAEQSFNTLSPSITITSPNGGEIRDVDSTYFVDWNTPHTSDFSVRLSVDNGVNWTNIGSVNDSYGEQSVEWTVPNTPSTQCLVSVDDENNQISDTSDAVFTIRSTSGSGSGPQITLIDPVEDENVNTASVITAQVAGPDGVQSVSLFYRQGGVISYTEVAMNLVAAPNYAGTIPASAMTIRGVEFFVRATDNQSNSADSDIFVIQVNVTNISNPTAQPAGSAVTNYRLFSVPLQLTNNTSADFLVANNLGSYDETRYRWYGFNIGSQQLVEYPGFLNVTPGKGFLFITTLSSLNISSGPGKSVETDEDFLIPAVQGWQLIGNPFNFDIPYDSLYSVPPVNFEIWEYNGSWQLNETGLQPWKGYALNMSQAASFYINPARSGLSKPSGYYSSGNKTRDGWLVQIRALQGEEASDFNYIGVDSEARDGHDQHDLSLPPRIGEQMQFILSREGEALSADIRKASKDGYLWPVRLISNGSAEEHRLSFEGIETIPPEFDVFLIEEVTSLAYNLREKSEIGLPREKDGEKRLTLAVGTSAFLSSQDLDVTLYPEDYELIQNYPNPFNPSTRITFRVPQPCRVIIEVYDMLGRRIEILSDEEFNTGTHVLEWDAQNYSSGVYFYRMASQDFSAIKKAVLVK